MCTCDSELTRYWLLYSSQGHSLLPVLHQRTHGREQPLTLQPARDAELAAQVLVVYLDEQGAVDAVQSKGLRVLGQARVAQPRLHVAQPPRVDAVVL